MLVDAGISCTNNSSMETHSPDIFSELHQAAVGAAANGQRASIDQACQRMDRRREELRKRIGEIHLSSELMHEVREP